MFGRSWEPGSATIVAKHIKNTSGSGDTVTREFAADVVTDGGVAFRALMQEPTIATDFWAPGIGDVVRVHADVKRGVAKFDKDDPKISFKAYKAGAAEAFEATLAQPPQAAPDVPTAFSFVSPDVLAGLADLAAGAAVAGAGAQADPAERLAKLKALHDQGIVTDDEYEAKRQEIIRSL